MKDHVADISLQYFTHGDEKFLQAILSDIQATGSYDNIFYPGDDTLDYLMAHYSKHSISIGYLLNHNDIIGLGGFRYVHDVALYEMVCGLLPAHRNLDSEVAGFLIDIAMYGLGMDKICARALPGTAEDGLYKKAGFTCLGERAFTIDDRSHIWTYYEMENDNNLTLPAYKKSIRNDWDNIF